MLDLEPGTRILGDLVAGVRDDQLGAPTPCAETTLGDLLDHVDGLAVTFTLAARKDPAAAGASADASRLGADWRSRIPRRLAELAVAWKDPAAWTGTTAAGGRELPGEVAGTVATDEIVVHGWDVAMASGQSFRCDPALAEDAYAFARSSVARNPNGTPGLFGAPVRVPADAPLLDRLLGLTGRDPAWTPEAARG